MEKQTNFYSEENIYFRHLLKHHQKYLFLLLIIFFSLTFYSNYLNHKPLLMGAASYYHLTQAQEINFGNINSFFYLPFNLTITFLPESWLFLIPLFLSCASFFLFNQLAEKLKIPIKFSFIFLVFTIITPTFIFIYTTISIYLLFLFSILLGFFLLLQKNRWSWLALPVFLYATFCDLLSSLLLLLSMGIYFIYTAKKENQNDPKANQKESNSLKTNNYFQKKLSYLLIILIIFSILLNWLYFHQPWVIGPFHTQQTFPDLISDFGGLSGISISLFLLAILGIIFSWKKKNTISYYLYLLILLPAYFYSTQTIFYSSLILLIFAAFSFNFLFETNWHLDILKKFTFFLIILSIIFSTISYLERVNQIGPTSEDNEALTWIKENTAENQIVFSTPENGYFIKSIAQRQPFSQPHLQDSLTMNLSDAIFTSTYSSKTFPLLLENNISIIYITPAIKNKYPSEQGGLLFLLKNERFKLIHSKNEVDVWLFK